MPGVGSDTHFSRSCGDSPQAGGLQERTIENHASQHDFGQAGRRTPRSSSTTSDGAGPVECRRLGMIPPGKQRSEVNDYQ